jgi:hypothetical protein
MRRSARILALLMLLTALSQTGCTTVRTTNPPRTATEQFLISQAAMEAIRELSAEGLRGRLAFVDPTFFEAIDESYIIGELRAKLLEAGVALTNDRQAAEIIVETRTTGVGIDFYEFLLGIPSVNVGTVAAAAGAPPVPVSTPELALIKNTRQLGFAGVAFVAYWADTGELITSAGPAIGESHRVDWWFFGFGPTSIGDIPPANPKE